MGLMSRKSYSPISGLRQQGRLKELIDSTRSLIKTRRTCSSFHRPASDPVASIRNRDLSATTSTYLLIVLYLAQGPPNAKVEPPGVPPSENRSLNIPSSIYLIDFRRAALARFLPPRQES